MVFGYHVFLGAPYLFESTRFFRGDVINLGGEDALGRMRSVGRMRWGGCAGKYVHVMNTA